MRVAKEKTFTREQVTELVRLGRELTANYEAQKLTVAKGIRGAVHALYAQPHRNGGHVDMLKEAKEISKRRAEAIPFLLSMADLLEGKEEEKEQASE